MSATNYKHSIYHSKYLMICDRYRSKRGRCGAMFSGLLLLNEISQQNLIPVWSKKMIYFLLLWDLPIPTIIIYYILHINCSLLAFVSKLIFSTNIAHCNSQVTLFKWSTYWVSWATASSAAPVKVKSSGLYAGIFWWDTTISWHA